MYALLAKVSQTLCCVTKRRASLSLIQVSFRLEPEFSRYISSSSLSLSSLLCTVLVNLLNPFHLLEVKRVGEDVNLHLKKQCTHTQRNAQFWLWPNFLYKVKVYSSEHLPWSVFPVWSMFNSGHVMHKAFNTSLLHGLIEGLGPLYVIARNYLWVMNHFLVTSCQIIS